MQDGRIYMLITALGGAGLLFQVLGCALFGSWWPMLSIFIYILIPLPYLFCGQGDGDLFYSSSNESWWVDFGKFISGFAGLTLFAIPLVLARAYIITKAALVFELISATMVFLAVVVYDYFATRENIYF